MISMLGESIETGVEVNVATVRTSQRIASICSGRPRETSSTLRSR